MSDSFKVVNPRLLTSYAVSPQTRFMCKPCSILQKTSAQSTQRLTYAAVYLKEDKQATVLRFVEGTGRGTTGSNGRSAAQKDEFVLPDRDTNVHALIPITRKALLGEDIGELEIVVVHETKIIQSLASDLSTINWTFKWPTLENGNFEPQVDFAGPSTFKDLRKGLLSQCREGLAVLENWGLDEDSHDLLTFIRTSRTKGSTRFRRHLTVMRLPKTTEAAISASTRIATYEVQSISFPGHLEPNGVPVRPVIHVPATGPSIFAQFANTVVQWDVRDLEPSTKVLFEQDVASLLPLGFAELLVLRNDRCILTDLQWQMDRAEKVLTRKNPRSRGAGMKREREPALTTFENLQLVDIFYQAGIAVASKPGSLIAIPVEGFIPNKKQRTSPRSLAESVGTIQSVTMPAPGPFADTVREMLKDDRIADLEEMLAKDLDLSYERISLKDGAKGRSRIFSNPNTSKASEHSDDVVYWTFPRDSSTLIRRTDWAKAVLVCNEIFHALSLSGSQSPLPFFSASIFRWLALIGLLSSGPTGVQRFPGSFSTLDLIQKLATVDPTLSLIAECLSWPFHLDLEVVIQALNIAIESLDNPVDQAVLQLTDAAGEEVTEASEANSVADASRAAEEDLALAIASLDDGGTIRGGLLRSIFDRLNAFDDEVIVKALVRLLAPRQVVFLINLLRIELAEGGWTSRYTDEIYEEDDDEQDEREDGESPSDQSIRIIIKLLNAAMDAIGPTGWNVSLSSDKQLNSDEMILVLRAEITAALEGSQEYQAIGAALQDFGRYCAQLGAVDKAGRKRKTNDAFRDPGFVRDDSQDALLPMGARFDQLETTRTSKGGRVTAKSKGAIGQELSMRVGKYSLDRIRV